MKPLIKLFFFLLSILVNNSFAQISNIDSSHYPTYVDVDNYFFDLSEVDDKNKTIVDSSYFKVSFIPTDSLIAYQFLGVPGLAFRNLFFEKRANLTREYGYNNFLDYFNEDKVLFNSKTRFSKLMYILGSGKEQNLDVLHSQNLLTGLNFTLNYQRLSSEGYLRRQFTRQSSFKFYPWYFSKKNKYSAFFLIKINNNEIQENGGTGNDSLPGVNDLNLLSIRLSTAQNETRNSSLKLYQKVGFKKMKEDSLEYTHTLSHLISYTDEKSTYSDTDPSEDFYNTFYYDTSNTKDRIRLNKIYNTFQYTVVPNSLFSGAIYLRNDLLKLQQRSLDTTLNSLYSGANFQKSIKNFKLSFKGEYGISGPSKEDYLIYSTLSYDLLSKYLFLIGYTQKENFPNLIYSVFQSNHFSWFNFLNKINHSNYFFKFNSPHFNTNFSIGLHSIKNYTFFNEQSRPEQHSGSINILNISLSNKIKLGRFGLASKILYQKVDETTILNLPEIGLSAKVFYENYLFNNALFTNLGIECEYMSTFTGDAYMPPLRQFYLQHEIEAGGYPQLNLFINFKIKTARVFFKVNNINSGMIDDFYYTVPNYPMPGRVFKVGVEWMFFD